MFGHQYILPIIMDYLAEHPRVSIRTLFVDRMVNIVDEGVDLAVRIGNLPNSGFSALRVGSVRRVVCGSPGYFEKNGVPTTPADLASHSVISATSAWASPLSMAFSMITLPGSTMRWKRGFSRSCSRP